MNRTFQQVYSWHGTLAANIATGFVAPFDMQLIHVSAYQRSGTTDTLLDIGTSADDDAYLDGEEIGAGTEFDLDDFVGGQFPHIAKGATVSIKIDFDGDSGDAAIDPTIVLTFTEG